MLSSMVNKKIWKVGKKVKIYDYLYLHVCAHTYLNEIYSQNDQTKGIETGWVKRRGLKVCLFLKIGLLVIFMLYFLF